MATITFIRCPLCGAKNRVSTIPMAGGLTPVCGRCKTPLPAEGAEVAAQGPVVVTDATFAEQVERSPVPVLVDFWAPWCGPCRSIAPIIDQLAGEMGGRVRFAKLNVDDNPIIASRFHVSSIPTLLIVKAGKEIDRIIGLQPAAEIKRRLQKIA